MINAGGNVLVEVVPKDLFKHSFVYSSVESSLVLTMVKPIKIFLDDLYYYPGSTVKGSVLVSADKPKQYIDITISILGLSRVRWTESKQRISIIMYNAKQNE